MLYKILNIFFALVWFANGLLAKIMNLVPRHQEIVGTILGEEYAWHITKAIGTGEILLGIWILTGIKSRFCALLQMGLILTMNILEFTIAQDLLLWGKMNSIYALMFVILIGINEFVIKKKSKGAA